MSLCAYAVMRHPLALLLANYGAAAALTDALYNLLVGQDALAAGTPVDGHAGLVGQAVLVHLQEYPLRPLVVLGVGGVDYAVPVEAVAEHLQLLRKALYVALRDVVRMHVVGYGVVLGGQAEGVEAYREEDVLALHAALARHDVHRGVRPGMTDMQSLSGGIRELDQGEELLLGPVAGHGLVGLVLKPVILPFLFYTREIVAHFNLLLPLS